MPMTKGKTSFTDKNNLREIIKNSKAVYIYSNAFNLFFKVSKKGALNSITIRLNQQFNIELENGNVRIL